MHLYQGKVYNDDRLFIIDLTRAKRRDQFVWAVITRRNHESFPAFRVDEFETKQDAMDFIKKIEPTTPLPLISLRGKPPEAPLSYDLYCKELKKQGVPSPWRFMN